MVIGVIDIGTNTTRLLVADADGDRLDVIEQRRHFLAPHAGLEHDLADLVEEEGREARRLGAEDVLVAGTAALRGMAGVGELERACGSVAAALRVLSEQEEAELAFLGATSPADEQEAAMVAVIDVGGGSTELAAGKPGEVPGWWASRPVGSRSLTDSILVADPPTREQLAEARNTAGRMLNGAEPQGCEAGMAVGGGAASLRRLCGDEIDRDVAAEKIELLLSAPAEEVATRLDLAPQRVRLLPAALVILEAGCDLLPEPLSIARGGMREGLAISRARELATA